MPTSIRGVTCVLAAMLLYICALTRSSQAWAAENEEGSEQNGDLEDQDNGEQSAIDRDISISAEDRYARDVFYPITLQFKVFGDPKERGNKQNEDVHDVTIIGELWVENDSDAHRKTRLSASLIYRTVDKGKTQQNEAQTTLDAVRFDQAVHKYFHNPAIYQSAETDTPGIWRIVRRRPQLTALNMFGETSIGFTANYADFEEQEEGVARVAPQESFIEYTEFADEFLSYLPVPAIVKTKIKAETITDKFIDAQRFFVNGPDGSYVPVKVVKTYALKDRKHTEVLMAAVLEDELRDKTLDRVDIYELPLTALLYVSNRETYEKLRKRRATITQQRAWMQDLKASHFDLTHDDSVIRARQLLTQFEENMKVGLAATSRREYEILMFCEGIFE